ncbi:MAG: thioesterase family protein [Ruminiclostridium sp.]|nr:thioesterase family protein [Ruminiclostridium sp.]
MPEIGTKGLLSEIVTDDKTAAAMGSGTLPVYATPAMIALMEKTAMLSVAPSLGENEATVGTLLEISHLAACGTGTKVTCESELVEIDRKRLVFNVSAYNGETLIGKGRHERFIINTVKFMEKVNSK